MTKKFQTLLDDLADELNIDLDIDKYGACTILYDDILKVQLELDEMQENLIVFSILEKVPPGKFRENIFLDALKANDEYPYIGIFSYLEEESSLSFHNYLPLDNLTTKKLSSFLSIFIELSLKYKKALQRGQYSFLL